MYLPFFGNSSVIETGSYCLHYTVNKNSPDFVKDSLPIIVTPKSFSLLGKTIRITKTEYKEEISRYSIYVDVLENPIPLVYFATGIVFVLGLSLVYLTFDKIEKVFNDSGVVIVFICIVIALAYISKIVKLKT